REELRHRTYRYEIEVAGFLERRGPVNVELGEWFQAGGAQFVQLRFDSLEGLQQISGGSLRQRRQVQVRAAAQGGLALCPVHFPASVCINPRLPNQALPRIFQRPPRVRGQLW